MQRHGGECTSCQRRARHRGALAITDATEAPASPQGSSRMSRTHRRRVVDDHAMFRTGVTGRARAAAVACVGEAADVDQAVRPWLADRPEVVLLDVHLPGGGGAR
jgi:hypothetical protein